MLRIGNIITKQAKHTFFHSQAEQGQSTVEKASISAECSCQQFDEQTYRPMIYLWWFSAFSLFLVLLFFSLATLVADYPDTYKLTGQDEVSKTYSFPKSHVSYRKPRTVSTEQRERARQMMIANK